MMDKPRVTLIFDPFAICSEAGVRVSNFESERQAFRDIDDLLRRDSRFETVVPMTYVISAVNVEHFKTYHGVENVEIKKVTPRALVREVFNLEPPDWLSDDLICTWRLLDLSPPDDMLDDGWPATVASWLIPGVAKAETLDQWFRVTGDAQNRFADQYGTDPVSSWIQERFSGLAAEEISSREVVSELRAKLTRAESPVAFANEWMRRKACLPLTKQSLDNPFRIVGMDHESAQDRAIASQLPLPFPLPSNLHKEVSQHFCRAIQTVRIKERHRLSEAAQSLNAIWQGVPEEIDSWLKIYPKGLTNSAASHLPTLPGFEASGLLRKIVEWYRPPETIAPWTGMTDVVEEWIASYSLFIRNCFLRRYLDESDDPALEFGRWLRDHHSVSFDHHKYSYCRVAKAVQKALHDNRTVLLVMVDALPIHLASDIIDYMNNGLGDEPTNSSYMFVPVPTVTSVCKEAVLTGRFPCECGGDLRSQLKTRYGLEEEELHVAANWQDAERLHIESETRLIVYRDNRIDDQLHNLKSYRTMLEDSHGVFRQIASLIKRWSNDIRCIRQESPLVLVTSDHGFTYGPAPGHETTSHRALDGTHRCTPVDGQVENGDVNDPSVAVIDKDNYHLRSNYLAAQGRYFGKGTVSGWSMAHGGLLPEEVIVPYLEWFGQEQSTPCPRVSFPDELIVDRDVLSVSVMLSNVGNLSTLEGSLTIAIPGEEARATKHLPAIAAGESERLSFQFAFDKPPQGDKLPVDVIIKISKKHSGEPFERREQFLVKRARRLVEQTKKQADFENMF